jgi:hypothetical protein
VWSHKGPKYRTLYSQPKIEYFLDRPRTLYSLHIIWSWSVPFRIFSLTEQVSSVAVCMIFPEEATI